jgi:fermentation-respiration switch protein FrsA (DUF1100 family)
VATTHSSLVWRIWRVARIVLVVYLLIVLLMMFFEESLVFFPAKYPAGDWQPHGFQFEDVWFTAEDETPLHGWFVPHDRPRATALFLHGNAGNITHRDDVLRALHNLGVAIMIVDYRGYGRSEGKPSEQGVLDDARSARTWLAERTGLSPNDIVLMGESLGGAVATILASESPARGLVVENSFSCVPDVAAFHYPWLPVRLMRTRLDAVAAIKNYHGPLLQFHGDADTIIPIELGRRLFDAANQPKRFVTISGADHNDPRSPQFAEELNCFLGELPPVKQMTP